MYLNYFLPNRIRNFRSILFLFLTISRQFKSIAKECTCFFTGLLRLVTSAAAFANQWCWSLRLRSPTRRQKFMIYVKLLSMLKFKSWTFAKMSAKPSESQTCGSPKSVKHAVICLHLKNMNDILQILWLPYVSQSFQVARISENMAKTIRPSTRLALCSGITTCT